MNRTDIDSGFARTEIRADDEFHIRELIFKLNEAVKNRDIEGILSVYAEDAEIFDVRDSLRYFGRDHLREAWQECFVESAEFEIADMHELRIDIDGNVAFSRCLSHAKGRTHEGVPIDVWMRVTTCYSKIGGRWLVAHEHVSVPGDFRTGKLLQDLKPEMEFLSDQA